MDLDTLKADYTAIVKPIRRELAMRHRYRGYSEAERKVRIAELEKVLEIAERWKDALKATCEPEIEQAALLDEGGGPA
jgi:hypothetical protein